MSAAVPVSLATAQDGETVPLRRVLLGSEVPAAVQGASEAKAETPFMGVTIASSDHGGVEIGQVHDKSGAAEAGLQAGDIVLRVADQKTPNTEALVKAIRSHAIGDQVAVVVQREGKEKLFLVSLGERPKSAQSVAEIRTGGSSGISLPWGKGKAKAKVQAEETVDAILVEEMAESPQAETKESKRMRWFGGGSDEAQGQDTQDHSHWLEVVHPDEGHAQEWAEILDLEGVGESLHVHGLEPDKIRSLVLEGLQGHPKKGTYSFEWSSSVSSKGKGIPGQVHKILEKHLGDHEGQGKAQVYVKVITPDGEDVEVFEFLPEAKPAKRGQGAKVKQRILQAKEKAAKARNVAEKKARKAKQTWIAKIQGDQKAGASCCDCGCPCGSEETDAKQERTEAKIRQQLEREQAAHSLRQRAQERRQRARDREMRAKQRAEQRASRRRASQAGDLHELQAELKAMRAQLAELRQSLREMRRHMQEHERR